MRILKTLLLIIASSMVIISCNNLPSDDLVVFNAETKEILLKETTTDAVKLEYKFTKGTKTDYAINLDAQVEMMGQQMTTETNMEGQYEITGVDTSGNASILFSITRIAIAMPLAEISFDSNNEEDRKNPQGVAISQMLNKSVNLSVNPSGKVLSVEYGEMEEMMKMQMEQNVSQFNQTTFILLPDNEVKEGYTYQDETAQNFRGLEIITVNQYTVRSISKDKTMVILDLEGKMNTVTTLIEDDAEIKINNGTVTGWIFVDLNKGFIAKSYISSKMDISMTQMGQQMDMTTITNILMNAK